MQAVSLSQRLLTAARGGEDRALDASIAELAIVDPTAIAGDPARIAFWLNVYNSRLLHSLREHPRSGHLFRHRHMFRATAYEVGGGRYSLDAIEHGLLRGNRRPPLALRRTLPAADRRLQAAPSRPDPRIHFALNCGAVSCPPVRAYSAEKLGLELEDATRSYIGAEARVDEGARRLELPGLMRLYRADFDDEGGAVAFALRYLPKAAGASRFDIGYERFDWSLQTDDLSAK